MNAVVRVTDKMPEPQSLKVGDRVRFVSLPEEWKQAGYSTPKMSVTFMKRMLKRATPVRVKMIDKFGTPWIEAVTIERGRRNYHFWAITENTGWRKVMPRKPRIAKT